jgi:hypothetical protein
MDCREKAITRIHQEHARPNRNVCVRMRTSFCENKSFPLYNDKAGVSAEAI